MSAAWKNLAKRIVGFLPGFERILPYQVSEMVTKPNEWNLLVERAEPYHFENFSREYFLTNATAIVIRSVGDETLQSILPASSQSNSAAIWCFVRGLLDLPGCLELYLHLTISAPCAVPKV